MANNYYLGVLKLMVFAYVVYLLYDIEMWRPEFWPRHGEEAEIDPSKLETFKKAYEIALRTRSSEIFEIPEDQLTPEQIETFENSITPLAHASHLVGIHQGHTCWPEVLEESGVQPAMVVTFRAGRIGDENARIKTHTYINISEVPKLALAAQKFNAPEGAITLQRVAEALHVAPAFVQDVIEDEAIRIDTFRNPDKEEFDSYLTKENVLALFLAIKARRQ